MTCRKVAMSKAQANAEETRLYQTLASSRIKAYYHRECKAWHVGHRPRPRKTRRHR